MLNLGSVRGNKLMPGIKIASLQALKPKLTSRPAQSQGLKLQAKILKRQDPMTRVQAYKPKLWGASNKDKGILWMLYVEANLVG